MSDARHLEASLNELRAEIAALDIHDTAARARLETLLADLQATVDDPRSGTRASLGDQLKSSILAFEASHPRLAALMNDVMEKLGNIGI